MPSILTLLCFLPYISITIRTISFIYKQSYILGTMIYLTIESTTFIYYVQQQLHASELYFKHQLVHTSPITNVYFNLVQSLLCRWCRDDLLHRFIPTSPQRNNNAKNEVFCADLQHIVFGFLPRVFVFVTQKRFLTNWPIKNNYATQKYI